MTKEQRTYQQMRAELDALMTWFEQDNIDVDTAVTKYEQAIKLAKEIEVYLRNAENKINKLKP